MGEPPIETRRSRLIARIGRLSPIALATIGLVILSSVGAGGYYAYRTYDFIEHDNDFCVSCHLMQEPHERFAQSAHRGLGCKACHRPTPTQRSSMALTQFLENPDSLGIHAEVPNEVCAECHIQGDPTRWASIAASAGHRIHLESDDPVLDGLRCVECHSTGVHEFAPVDRTCAQSGCHTESGIQLGAMSQLTVHCVACHAFQAQAPGDVGTEAFAEALAPDRDTCLSCHEMRILVQLPEPDPHEGACSACHNPHQQTTPAEAVLSCATSACHEPGTLDDLSPFHAGLDTDVIADCIYCHVAHDFSLDGSDCTACHQRILEDDPTVQPRSTADSIAPSAGVVGPGPGLRATRAALAVHVADAGFPSWNAPTQERPSFQHSRHADLACTACHTTEERHGALTVTAVQDCRSCHHVAPASDDCTTCHVESNATADPYRMVRRVDFTVRPAAERTLPFDHEVHGGEACATCHVEGLALSAAAVDCASCHADHHDPSRSCRSCHAQAPTSAHPVAQAHVTCAGAGCHTDGPFTAPPRTREVCLGCHQDQVGHRPEQPNCAECHALPSTGVG
jgi:nitrate/TMAO reductase-like tetraheme cytochrome c subunit